MTAARMRLVQGLVSGLAHEAFIVLLSFAAMLALVRLLTPRDYGEAAAVAGVLALLRAFSGALFVEHALQHEKEQEPDWDAYVAVGGVVQIAQFIIANGIALIAGVFAATASLGLLLHIASLGLLLEWPAQIASVKLRRELRFARLQVLTAFALIANLTTAIVLGVLGFGAAALVIAGNVVTAVPMACSFLFIERWRPRRTWLCIPARAQLRPILEFGREQIASGLLQSVRSAAESIVLTKAFGLTTFGLINRASALFHSTIGRFSLMFLDTAYPLLPMERSDPARFSSRASRFVEAALILTIPGAAYIVVDGARFSRLLYGDAWSAADPFLAPAALALSASTLATAASYVLLGFGKVRQSVVVEGLIAIAGIAALFVPLIVTNPVMYMWTLATAQIVAAVIAFILAAPLLERGWQRRGVSPALAASSIAMAGVIAARGWLPVEGAFALAASASLYGLLAAAVIAVTARSLVAEVVHVRDALLRRTRLIATEV